MGTVLRIVLVALLTFVGLFVGLVVGGTFFVPAGSGLAGPAIALMWGLGGGAVALIGGVIAAPASRTTSASTRSAGCSHSRLCHCRLGWFRLSVVSAAPAGTSGAGHSPRASRLLTFAQGAMPVSIGGAAPR